MKLTGKLGDGTVISQGGSLTSDGRFQVFIPLYKGRGVLSGWVDFVPTDEISDFNGTLRWSKPDSNNDSFYSDGFDLEIDLLGSRFTPPAMGQRILSLGNEVNNGVLMLGGGNLDEPLSSEVTLDARNKVHFSEATIEKPKLVIAGKSGLFKGSFLHPQLGKRAKFSGVVFQKQRIASGVFRGQNQAGYVTLQGETTDVLLLPAPPVGTPSNEITDPPSAEVRFSLGVSAVNGNVTKAPALANYSSGATVQLTATPAPGFIFDHWSGDGAGTQNPLTVTMTMNKTVTANFVTAPPPVTYTINTSVAPENAGTTSGAGTFGSGETVTLTALASDGYTFANWTEGGNPVSTNSTYSFTASSNRTLVASFSPAGPIVVQPGPMEGKDFFITSVYGYQTGTNGAGGAHDGPELRCGGWGDEYRSLLQFDIASLPSSVTSAKIRLYAPSAGTTAIYVDRLTSAWQWSSTFVWNDRPQFEPFQGPLPAASSPGWYEIDITSLYNGWKAGTFPNHGVQLRPQTTSDNNFSNFHSSNYADDPTLRPQLIVYE